MSLYEFFGRKMKIYKIAIIVAGLFILQGCDSQETKVKKLLKCGLAVNEVGNSLAQENYKKMVSLLYLDAHHHILALMT